MIDLKLDGTGLRPGLQGQVRLANFEATLPFSRLTVRYGFLFFDRDDPLNPRIEMHGTSRLRDYTIHVFVYGTALAPEAVFNSEPPLPQEEIISLLATGATREELTGGGNVLASRAAILLVRSSFTERFSSGATKWRVPSRSSIGSTSSLEISTRAPDSKRPRPAFD